MTFLQQMAILTSAGIVAMAQAPAPATPPYALLQYSNLTASGNAMTMTRVPVVTAAGKTIYLDLTVQFDVDPTGNMTLAFGYPVAVVSPTVSAFPFSPGRYETTQVRYGIEIPLSIDIVGPRSVAGGATWILNRAPGTNTAYPVTATWYAGPIESSPYAARVKLAAINTTSSPWSYGVTGTLNFGSSWGDNTLVGIAQIGKTRTIASFTRNGRDSATPVDQITYELRVSPTP